MARQPSSLLDEVSAVVAENMGAVKTAALIRKPDPLPHLPFHLAEVVAQAMAELKPADFRELLKRTRDRKAALEALHWIEEKVSKWPLEMLGVPIVLWEITSDACRGYAWKPYREEVKELFEESAERFAEWKIRRRHRVYTHLDFQHLIRFIGEGNDAKVMEDTLQKYANKLTYAQGAWLREQMRLRLRTPEQIAADQRERRISRAGHWSYTLR